MAQEGFLNPDDQGEENGTNLLTRRGFCLLDANQ